MDIANRSRTHKILKKYDFKFKKRYGQNFLLDANILKKMVDLAEVNKHVSVIEIGPGIGALTQYLARSAGSVVAYEIDTTLIPILKEVLAVYTNVKIINEDILQADVESMIKKHLAGSSEIAVVANLPYYITTPILMMLIKARLPIDRYVVMMQLEVARRLSARPRTKDYNALSIAIQYYCDVGIAMNVPRHVFIPTPNVDSAVVVLKRKPKPSIEVEDEAFFLAVVHACFKHRRKTLLNNLSAYFKTLTKDEISNNLQEVGISPSSRAESLKIQEFARLADVFVNKAHCGN